MRLSTGLPLKEDILVEVPLQRAVHISEGVLVVVSRGVNGQSEVARIDH